MNGERDQPAPETVPEPQEIQSCRKVVADLTRMIDAGEVEAISCYVSRRDGMYQNVQSQAPGKHEDVGRMFELILLRLGFRQPDDAE